MQTAASPNTLTITKPDDWHLHLRDGDALASTVPAAGRQFQRGIVMPNLVPPVTTVERANAYRERILAKAENPHWQPLMVLYLTDNTPASEISAAKQAGIVGCKYYPAGATTNSDSGVTDIKKIYPLLDEMQKQGLVLQLHGEVTDAEIDIFDREAVFIERYLGDVVANFPELKIVLEHITTREGAEFVASAPTNVAATLTPQHLLGNRNDMLVGGVRPHLYCLPILKRREHQLALIQHATSGSAKFFLGTDSAPHAKHRKEAACGCAGCYSHHAAMELYAEAFDRAGQLANLEGFASHHGPDFYGLPRNRGKMTLVRESWQLPDTFPLGDDSLVPLYAGETINWKVTEITDE